MTPSPQAADELSVDVYEWGTREKPPSRQGRLQLQSERRWVVEGRPSELDAIASALPPSTRTRVGSALVLDFVNSVGDLELPHLGPVELYTGKWGEKEFEGMLAELTEVAAGLPFSARDTAAIPYDRSVAAREDVLYHAFVYLRYALSDRPPRESQLVPALRVIQREPHRHWRDVRREVRLHALSRVDSHTLHDLVTATGTPVLAGALSPAGTTLARRLHGRLPEHVSERHIRSSVDTAENRFVKAFIGQATAIIGRTRDAVSGARSDAFRVKIETDCDRMERSLQPIVRHSLWQDVGPMVHLPLSSTVLQRRRGYRQVFRHFAKMRLATRIPLDTEAVRDLLELKNIALLYELWTFFRVVNVLRDIAGPPARAGRPSRGRFEVSVGREMAVEWPSGLEVIYNPPFSRSRPVKRRSYSVPLRPDIALRIPSGPNRGLHLFDAKFRVRHLSDVSFDASDDEDDEKAEERRGTFKRGDIYKMHAYRDAIPEARSVWILYPGSEFKFFEASGLGRTRSAPASLPDSLDGVGAVALGPGSEESLLRPLLECLMGNSTSLSGAESSAAHSTPSSSPRLSGSNGPSRSEGLAAFRRFVSNSRWRFAKTYVESYPHEYTLQRWVDEDDFRHAIRCIEERGVVEPFYRTRRKYLHLDDRKYWHMGDADSEDRAERPGLINRTWLDVSRYRDEARALGYEGPELEELVERWSDLLARARGES